MLTVLEELRIPYRTEFIPAHAKPAWFYLLHRENRAPVVNHDTNLVEDSKHIASYLIQRFPDFFGAHTAYSSAHGGRKRLFTPVHGWQPLGWHSGRRRR